MTKVKPTEKDQVTEHINKLEKPLKTTIHEIRELILSVDKEISEQIKWNSPSFYYNGAMKPFDPKEYKRDIIVVNHHRGKILLVFPTGASISDTTGVLEGKYTDGRRMVSIADPSDLKKKAESLKKVIKIWLSQVEK